MQNQKSDIRPFRMYGNLYFVGSSAVSVHVIKTTAGLVMIDAGYPDMYEQILCSMEEVGLNPKDICAIFHSHGHIDHFGCTMRLKAISGAGTYISRIDNAIVNGTYDWSWAKELGLPRAEPFDCDVLVEDGDVFTFGDTTVRCALTPGHTEGVLSFFVNVEEDGKSIIAAMHGGIGMNSMTAEFLDSYGFSKDCREIFRRGLHSLKHEKVDLVMGNHPFQNDTEGKLKRLEAGEQAFVDSAEWIRFLEETEATLDEMLQSEKEK